MATMGFLKKQSNAESVPLVKEIFTNAICYGKTGSGKTSCFILPNIEKRIKLGHGLLIYDFKGNLHEQVKILADQNDKLDDVIEIGKLWGKKTNIIKNLDKRTLREAFLNLYGTNENSSFWSNSAVNLFSALHQIFNAFEQCLYLSSHIKNSSIKLDDYIEKTSLASIANVTRSLEDLQLFFKSSKQNIVHIEKIIFENIHNSAEKKRITKMAHYIEDIEASLSSIKSYENLNDNGETGGLYSVLNTLNIIISKIARNEAFNVNEIDVVQNLRKGKIVILNLANIDDADIGLINLAFYSALQKNIDKLNNTPVTIFIDEAQKVLTAKHLPDVDVCREHKFEYIFATQDALLLYSTIGQIDTEKLLRNIIEQYSFSSNDKMEDDLLALNQFEYYDLISKKSKLANPIFFSYEEKFLVEYKYQTKLGVFSEYVDMEGLPKDNIYIALDSPEVYQEDKIYLKDKNENILQTNLACNDYSILEKYKKADYENFQNSYWDIVQQEIASKEDSNDIISLKRAMLTLYKRIDSLEEKVVDIQYKCRLD